MGQNQSYDEETDSSQSSDDEIGDDEIGDEEGRRCIVSDPAQPHNLYLRYGYKAKHGCFSCGEKGGRWRLHLGENFHYYCTVCDVEFHYTCLEYPSMMIHPYHPQHPLTFTFFNNETGVLVDATYGEFYKALVSDPANLSHAQYLETTKPNSSILFDKCTWCRKDLREWFYRCSICNFSLDFHCAQNFPPLTIQNPNSHHHPLLLFPRPLSFSCYACGLINMSEPSYACYQCGYFVHQSCIDLPRVIKITRHPHRLSHTPYLPATVSLCRVCYKNVDIKYGQYSCTHGDCSYVVHSKCATHRKIWAGGELEWAPEEPDESKDIAPFKRVGDDLIEHFRHHHHYLRLEKYDDHMRDSEKLCHACIRPITSLDFYSCIECDFFLHEVCANLPRKLDLALHNHALFMDPYPEYEPPYKWCSVCYRHFSGLMYKCKMSGCTRNRTPFQVDVNCILVPEYIIHESHADHPLFISTPYSDERQCFCHGCKRKVLGYHLQCTSCEFAICYNCATIPHEIYHKYDEEPLSLCYGESGVDDNQDLYWCEVCEKRLDPTEWFYTNNSTSCTTIHRACLFGDNVYMKPGHTFGHGWERTVEVVSNNSSSRPTCRKCQLRCPQSVYFKVYIPDGTVIHFCSFPCLISL